jgi:hypothetical protein
MIYLVLATIQPKHPKDKNIHFKQLKYQGIYVSKKSRAMKEKIEKECTDYLLKNLKNDNPEINFEFKNFKIDRYNSRFTLNEE